MARSAADRAVEDFNRDLIKFKDKIIKLANGSTCGTCDKYVTGLCIEHDIDIFTAKAIACFSYRRQQNAGSDVRSVWLRK